MIQIRPPSARYVERMREAKTRPWYWIARIKYRMEGWAIRRGMAEAERKGTIPFEELAKELGIDDGD